MLLPITDMQMVKIKGYLMEVQLLCLVVLNQQRVMRGTWEVFSHAHILSF